MQTQFNPDITLDRSQQAALVQTCSPSNEGWNIVNMICRNEVDKFILDMINTEATNAEDVLKKHLIAKTAAQLYEGVIRRINYEMQKYTASNTSKEPVDMTEGILDIGPLASTQKDFEDFQSLGGDDLDA